MTIQPVQKTWFPAAWMILAVFVFSPGVLLAAQAQLPFPRHLRYAFGTIRPTGHSQAELDGDVQRLYEHWKANYLVRVVNTAVPDQVLYRVSHGRQDPWRTVSEGQGYGMLITVMMAGYDPQAREIFDGLYRFSRLHPSRTDSRLMAWEVPENEDTGVDAAFDGDADMAQALLMATRQWPDRGEIDYLAAAGNVLAGIRGSMIGPESHLPLLGDWVFREGPPYGEYTPRSSDFMPDHFRSWQRMTGDRFWGTVLQAVQDAVTDVQARCSPSTGLLPDFLVPRSPLDHRLVPAPAGFLEGPFDGDFEYNAGRVPWRIGVDGLLFGDPVSLAQAGRMAVWIADATGGDPARIMAGYTLSGRVLPDHDYFTSFFAAPLAVAAMTRPELQTFLDDLYDTIRNRREDYYEDSVTLLCLLVLSGNYWVPDGTPVAPALSLLLDGK